MTDRFDSLTIVLETDIREDDAEHLINAIKQLRGVLEVTGNVSTSKNQIGYIRAKNEIWDTIFKLYKDAR